jgi:hypothetical protein
MNAWQNMTRQIKVAGDIASNLRSENEAKKIPVCKQKQASNIERRMEVKKVSTYVSHTIS